jgi:hypothetical protein
VLRGFAGGLCTGRAVVRTKVKELGFVLEGSAVAEVAELVKAGSELSSSVPEGLIM